MSEHPTTLVFLKEFLNNEGITPFQIAEKKGISVQAVYRWFQRDDLKLSTLEDMLRPLGYRTLFNVEGIDDDVAPTKQRYRVVDGNKVVKTRLSAIQQIMAYRGISQEKVGEMIGRTRTSVTHMFKVDDMFLSDLFTLTRVLNLKWYIVFCRDDAMDAPKCLPDFNEIIQYGDHK